jgi:PhnB protein
MDITPYIIFNGNCEEALNFYAQTFHGEIKELHRFEGSPVQELATDKNQVMHATFVAKGLVLLASDGGRGQSNESGSGMLHLSLQFEDIQEMEKIFSRLSEGGKVTMALNDTFWGARFGMLIDKFGIKWMFNSEHKPQKG